MQLAESLSEGDRQRRGSCRLMLPAVDLAFWPISREPVCQEPRSSSCWLCCSFVRESRHSRRSFGMRTLSTARRLAELP